METKARYAIIGLFTLGAIIAVFGFVYWLQNMGGIGQRATYQIRFESPVSGLLAGSNVLFNGMRVGEVTSLQLTPERPNLVLVTIAVDPSTPIRTDTAVSMDFQGLTGAPVIVLTGGSPTAKAVGASNGQPPLLVAAADAGQTLTQSARNTLGRIDGIMADNATSFHDAVVNISKFSEVLGRNSERIDGILAGLERMTGGGSGKSRVAMYSLTVPDIAPPCKQVIDLQLVVPDPGALLGVSTDKIPVRGTLADPGAFDNGQLADLVPSLLQSKVIESLENTKCFRSVTRPIEDIHADLKLVMDIRTFAILAQPELKADMDLSAKVMSKDGKILGSRVFHESADLKKADAASAAGALDEAFGKVIKALVPWTTDVAAIGPRAKASAP